MRVIVQSVLYKTTNKQSLVCLNPRVWQCAPSVIIATPDNFNPDLQLSPKTLLQSPTNPIVTPLTRPSANQTVPKVPQPVTSAGINSIPQLTREADKIAAKIAWKYFERNWNSQTGLVNSTDDFPWTTWWDQGSALLGIDAARQLGLLSNDMFQQRINKLLETLETLPLPPTGLPNKAYSTNTGQMRRLNGTPDPKGVSGWSALDMARFLLGLHVLRTHSPEYRERIDRIVLRWNLSKLVKDGWLNGAISVAGEHIREVQEGRLGYEQYAALSLKLWNIQAPNALFHSPSTTVKVDGITLQVDKRNLNNSGATNYLTNDPYLLWGLELGWSDFVKPQVRNLLQVQAQRFKHSGIVTAVNEDSLDRPPYFLYYNVYANGQPWLVINSNGQVYPRLRFVSTKAAFSWFALMSDNSYTQTLREFVQNLADTNRGYLSGRYENHQRGVNTSIDVNTNAIILESLLYQARGGRPLAF
jgi:hypothetical protein